MHTRNEIPTVSIVMPVNNTGKYLTECINSIMNQTYEDWELIAVENGSDDDSLTILKSWEERDRRIRVVHLEKADLLGALREGYRLSRGNLIHRMDSDDLMPKEKLSLMVEAWDKHGKGGVITGGTRYFSDEGVVGDGFLRYDKWLSEVMRTNSFSQQVYKECVIPSNCWLIHRDDFDKIGAFEPNIFPEDYDLCFRFIKGNLAIIGLPETLHFWRDRNDRISRNWECYADNRFFELKCNYFFDLERDHERPLVLWGAGKNGKALARIITSQSYSFNWACDNPKKVGHTIYGTTLIGIDEIEAFQNPQVIVAVASPDDQAAIKEILQEKQLQEGSDYWFFS